MLLHAALQEGRTERGFFTKYQQITLELLDELKARGAACTATGMTSVRWQAYQVVRHVRNVPKVRVITPAKQPPALSSS